MWFFVSLHIPKIDSIFQTVANDSREKISARGQEEDKIKKVTKRQLQQSIKSNPKMLATHKNIFLIRSRPDNAVLHCRHNDKTYLVGFMAKQHADAVVKTVSVSSRIEFEDYDPKGMSILSIEKRININKLPCYVQERDFYEFLGSSQASNCGIAFAYGIVEDTLNDTQFEVQTLDPLASLPDN